MRSNNPNATHFLLKRNLFIGVMIFLIGFFTLPYWALSNIPPEKEVILENTFADDQIKLFSNLVSSRVMNSMSLESWVVLYGGLGFLTAMMLMRHLFSRRQSMLQAALPDKRETDFLRRFIAYGVLCVVPIVLNFVLYLLVVATNGLLPYVAWGKLLPKLGLLLLINLYGFAMGMLSSVLTGAYWAALLAGAVLIVGVEAVVYLWWELARCYLHTLVDTSLSNLLRPFSPAMSLYKGFYRPNEFFWAPGVLAIVLSLALSLGLYRVRKTEAAERTLAFGWLHPFMGFALPLLGGSVMGIIFVLSFATEMDLVIGLVVGAVLTHLLCQMVFHQRFSGLLKQWYLPLASAAVLMLGVVVLHTDVMGYDHFLPEREQLTAITYRPQNYHSDELITLTSEDALDAAYGWCTLMRDEADGLKNGLNESARSDTDSKVVVTYHIGDRIVRRLYPNDAIRNDAQPFIQAVINSDDYQNSLINRYHLSSGDVDNLYLSIRGNVFRSGELYSKFGVASEHMSLRADRDKDTMDQWMEALEKDIRQRTFADKQDDPLYTLTIESTNQEDGAYEYIQMPIYPCDTNFLKLIMGDRMQAVIDYATGGYAADEDFVVMRVTYDMSRGDMQAQGIDSKLHIKDVTLAASPQEAVEWVKQTQAAQANRYYFMPDEEHASYSSLYLYRMSELERLQSYNHYEIPKDKTQFVSTSGMDAQMVRNFVGE